MITYQENKEIPLEQLEELYQSVGWSAYTEYIEILEKGIQQSLYVLTAWHKERLVGLIRVVGDGQTIIYIQDVLVHPHFQKQQIGFQLVTQVLDKYKEVRQKVLLTEDAPVIRYFYEKFEFKSCDRGQIVAFYKEY